MPNWFNLTLDTTPPSSPTISIENDAPFASTQLVDLTLATGDVTTSGYQMKIWGDVDTTFNSNIQTLDDESSWMTFNELQQIKLSSGDGSKTINFRIRDDVYNESSLVSKSINLDMSLPTVSITGPDVSKISKVNGRNVSSFSFACSEIFEEYKVCVVNSSGATEDMGAVIPTTNGSSNTTGSAGGYDTNSSPITISLTGMDVELASSGDGIKIIKVFVRDQAGQWSA